MTWRAASCTTTLNLSSSQLHCTEIVLNTARALEFSRVARVLVTLSSLLRVEFDHVVYAQDCDGGFCGELERLDLGYGGLEHAGGEVVAESAFGQVQAHPFEVRVFHLWKFIFVLFYLIL